MGKLQLSGVFPPITTPFKENGEVDFAAFDKNMVKWNGTDLAGYVVFGSNGEYVFLTEQEKLALVKACVGAAADDKKVIVGSGCESTGATIELTNKCANLGADAALIITPSYYKGKMNREALKQHFFTVADKSEIPILLYSVPKFTGINLEAEFVAELAQHPNIIGIKDSSGNVAQLGQLVSLAPADFNILVGTANVFFPGLMLGIKGGIQALATCCPDQCVRIHELFTEGKYQEAKDLQLRMLPVNNAITAKFGIAGLKVAMDLLGFAGGLPRKPLLPLTDKEKAELRIILEKAELI